MSRGERETETPRDTHTPTLQGSKNFLKNFQKPLDKSSKVWYNKYVIKRKKDVNVKMNIHINISVNLILLFLIVVCNLNIPVWIVFSIELISCIVSSIYQTKKERG